MNASPRSRPARRIVVAGAALLVSLLSLAAWWWQSRIVLNSAPLRNVPATAVGMVHLRWPQVRSSSLWQDVVVARGGDGALRALEAECGFDWSEGLDTLTAFADAEPGGSDTMVPEHIAFILTGPLELERMVACLGPSDGDPVQVADIEGVRTFSGGSEYHAALLDDDAVVVGHADAIRATIRTLRGDAASLADLPEIPSAYGLVSVARHISGVVRLDSRWRGAVEEILAHEAAFRGRAPSFVVVGARVERGLTLGALARFDAEPHAQSFVAALRTLQSEWSSRLAVALSPAGPALRSVATQSEGLDVTLAFDLDARRVSGLIEAMDAPRPE